MYRITPHQSDVPFMQQFLETDGSFISGVFKLNYASTLWKSVERLHTYNRSIAIRRAFMCVSECIDFWSTSTKHALAHMRVCRRQRVACQVAPSRRYIRTGVKHVYYLPMRPDPDSPEGPLMVPRKRTQTLGLAHRLSPSTLQSRMCKFWACELLWPPAVV